MAKSVKINGAEVACTDVLQIRLVQVVSKFMYEIKYRVTEPMYHEVVVLMDEEKGYALEKKVRKCCCK